MLRLGPVIPVSYAYGISWLNMSWLMREQIFKLKRSIYIMSPDPYTNT
jgi:hypothetical protein